MAKATWAVEEVRSGTIRLWHGLLADIPAGYALCDGTGGTPDLRGKFVKGAAAGQNPGSTGGAATHTHDSHAALSHSGAAVADHTNVAVPATATAGVKIGTAAVSAAALTHTHTITTITHTVTQPSSHAAQSHVAANSEPEYYTVAFIIKL